MNITINPGTPSTETIVLAAALSVEMVLGLVTNSFVILYSICHPKSLKKSSNLLLLSLLIVDLLDCLLVIPSPIVIIALGKDILVGPADWQKLLCNISGYLFAVFNNLLVYIIAAISVDRCIFITQPFHYRRYMQPKVVITIMTLMWIFVGASSSVPFYGFGRYTFKEALHLCSAEHTGNIAYSSYALLVYIAPIIVTVVTTIWTTLFTRRYLRRRRSRLASIARLRSIGSTEQLDDTNNIYSKQIRNLLGLFGLLLAIQAISVVPGVMLIAINFTDTVHLPNIVVQLAFILYNTNCIANPIIQAYFRKDLNTYVRNILKKLKPFCGSIAKGYAQSANNIIIASPLNPMKYIQITTALANTHPHQQGCIDIV